MPLYPLSIFRQGQMNELACFAGAGGGLLASRLLGWFTIAAIEIEPYRREVILQRQQDGCLGPFPIWDDVKTFDANPWQGLVDIITGGFPCFATGTMVLSERGFQSIESLSVGDRVLTHKGRWKRITSIMSRTADRTIIVKGHGFLDTRTTEEHPYYARRLVRKWNNQSRSYGRELEREEWRSANRLVGQSTYYGSQVLPQEPPCGRVVERGPEFWWLVGRYLADGWRARSNNKGRVIICANRTEADEVEEKIKAVYPCCRSNEKTVVKFHITRKELYDFLEPFGKGAAGKKVPGWCYSIGKENNGQFLQGYFTGDGHRQQGQWKATTISKALALGISLLAQQWTGTVAAVYENKVRRRGTIEGRSINQQTQYQIVLPDRNRCAIVQGKYGWKRIRSITKSTGCKVWNISIEDDESYVANGCIVHNCQDVSQAGKGLGIKSGKRSGLWKEIARIAEECRPEFIFVENSPRLVDKGLDVILMDCTNLGYDVRWGVLGAWHLGGHHRRDRIFVLAHDRNAHEEPEAPISAVAKEESQPSRDSRDGSSRNQVGKERKVPNSQQDRCNHEGQAKERQQREPLSMPGSSGQQRGNPSRRLAKGVQANFKDEPSSPQGLKKGLQQASEIIWNQSRMDRIAHGLAHQLDRVEAIGDGQVPQVVAMAFMILSDGWL